MRRGPRSAGDETGHRGHRRLFGQLMSAFTLPRLGMLMEPEPGNPQEIEGVLNPAAVRGPDGQLYLFPRLVAKGNYSRIGIALEPEADYERRLDGGGGCEDPRITSVESLQRYMMPYTAY